MKNLDFFGIPAHVILQREIFPWLEIPLFFILTNAALSHAPVHHRILIHIVLCRKFITRKLLKWKFTPKFKPQTLSITNKSLVCQRKIIRKAFPNKTFSFSDQKKLNLQIIDQLLFSKTFSRRSNTFAHQSPTHLSFQKRIKSKCFHIKVFKLFLFRKKKIFHKKHNFFRKIFHYTIKERKN